MAETKQYQKSSYPLPSYNFRVTVGETSMSFSEVSGLALEYETITYRHGLSFMEGEIVKKYYYDKSVTLTLKKGVVKGMRYLYDWLKERKARMFLVSLCDEQGQPVVSWKIAKALPVKLSAPSFNAGANDVAVESLEIMASGISIEYH